MKAAALDSPNDPLTIEDVALAKPGPREVLPRTVFAGLPTATRILSRVCIRIPPPASSAMNPRLRFARFSTLSRRSPLYARTAITIAAIVARLAMNSPHLTTCSHIIRTPMK